jgi:hypothetical protein
MHEHGGSIELVDGARPGACFRLSFPLLDDARRDDAENRESEVSNALEASARSDR